MLAISRAGVALAVLLGWWLLPGPALAHQLRMFAAVEGDAINGHVYFGGGAKIAGAQVSLFDSQGGRLRETRTGEGGVFRFAVAQRGDYRLVADAGAGHVAEFVITADEFPEPPGTDGARAAVVSPPGGSYAAAETASTPPPVAENDLQRTLESIVTRQIRPLREQLDAYEQQVRWHDVLGGIGYIFGLAGFAFYWLGRNRPPPKI
jgi:nickel transport protein